MSRLDRSEGAPAVLPAVVPADLTTEAVLDLYARFLEADRKMAPPSTIVQILDDWFCEQGFPSVLFRT
jgi:hypothetical protein